MQTTKTMTDGDSYDREIERLAEDRARIEKELQEQRREYDKLGTVRDARCTDFRRTEHSKGRYVGSFETRTRVTFTFELPDGSEETRSRYINNGKTPDNFMDTYGAASLTDMIGARHAAIYTQNGWQLMERAKPLDRLTYTHVDGEGTVYRILWPLVAAPLVLLVTAFPTYMSGVTSLSLMISTLALISFAAYPILIRLGTNSY